MNSRAPSSPGCSVLCLGSQAAHDVLAEDLFDVFNLKPDARVRTGGGVGIGHDVQLHHAAPTATYFGGSPW